MNTGKLIVIEGAVDGIGKSTQFALLRSSLENSSYKVFGHHFPSYGTLQGAPVEAYLAGKLGAPSSLSPYLVNSLYAIDRAVTWQTEMRKHFEAGEIILLDRYTTSSLIYQSSLLESDEEKLVFAEYVSDYEYNKLGIPRPDAVIFLDAPFEAAQSQRKLRRENDGIENDVHEKDDDFLHRVWQSAQLICDAQNWSRIRCTDSSGNMRTREEIHDDIMKVIREVLL